MPPNLQDYDIDFTLKEVNFNQTESIIRNFLDEYRTESRPEWESKNDGIHQIPANGLWDIELRYITFVIDQNRERLYLRIREPKEFHGVHLKDCIKHRDDFADGFIDYLIDNNLDIE